MMNGKAFSTVVIAGILAAGLLSNAYADDIVRRTTTTEASYKADSVEAGEIQRWLTEHARYQDGVRIGDPQRLGDVTVVVKKSESRMSAMVLPGGQPPMPLPSNGSNGDEISISSISGGVSQTWDYTWRGGPAGGWILVNYQITEVPR